MTEVERTKWVCRCEACTTHPRSTEATEHRKINRLLSGLDEKHARRVLGLLAENEGHGGIARLPRITGGSRTTILLGRPSWLARIQSPRIGSDGRVAAGSRSKKKARVDRAAAQSAGWCDRWGSDVFGEVDTEVDTKCLACASRESHQGPEDASGAEVSASVQSEAVDAEVVARSRAAIHGDQSGE